MRALIIGPQERIDLLQQGLQPRISRIMPRITRVPEQVVKEIGTYQLYHPPLDTKHGKTIYFAKAKGSTSPLVVREYDTGIYSAKALTNIAASIQILAQLGIGPRILSPSLTFNGHYYIFEEWCNMGSLASLQPDGLALGEDDMKQLVSFIGAALRLFSMNKITHNSLTPRHILLNFHVEGMISFKLCPCHESPDRIGGEVFCAPEILRSEKASIASEVYSFGITLYLMVTGTFPPKVDPYVPPTMGAVPYPKVHGDLGQLITQCLHHDCNCRPSPIAIYIHPFVLNQDHWLDDFVNTANAFLLDITWKSKLLEAKQDIRDYQPVRGREPISEHYYSPALWEAVGDATKRYTVKIVDLRGKEMNYPLAKEVVTEVALRSLSAFVAGINPVFSSFIYDHGLYIVSPISTGRPLDEYLADARAPPLTCVGLHKIAYILASAMREIHRHKLVHRYLQPKNVTVTNESVPNIEMTNFWSGYLNDTGSGTTYSLARTDRFVPPEYSNRGEFGPPGDVWCYGAILYYLIYKRPVPPEGIEDAKALTNLPQHYLELMQGCLKADPKARLTFDQVMRGEYLTNLPLYTTPNKLVARPTLEIQTIKLMEMAPGEREYAIQETLVRTILGPAEHFLIQYDYRYNANTLIVLRDKPGSMSLERYVREKESHKSQLSNPELMYIAKSVAQALRSLHKASLIIRQLRAAEIYVNLKLKNPMPIETLKINDWSWARVLLLGDRGFTQVFQPDGYYPPEAVYGYTDKSDIWLYGLLLYFCLFGKYPREYQLPGQNNTPAEVAKRGYFIYDTTRNVDKRFVELMKCCLHPLSTERPSADDICQCSLFASDYH